MTMQEILPPFLRPGSRVGLVATARWIEQEQLNLAIGMIEAQGWVPVVAQNVYEKHFQFAGDDQVRTSVMQRFLDDDAIDAIVCVRGGYGSVRIIDRLDFTRFIAQPKWLCGYSDFSVFLSHAQRLGVGSIHCSMPVSFGDCTIEANTSFIQALKGELNTMTWKTEQNESAECRGVIRGGNLSVLYSLLGSSSMPDFRDSIVFLEDVDEMIYHVDRMMRGMMRAGVFEETRGILLGGMTQMKDNTQAFGFKTDNPFGESVYDVIRSIAQELGLPFVSGFPAGHQNDNRAFYLGRPCEIVAGDGVAHLRWL